jgi:hypothetical protein
VLFHKILTLLSLLSFSFGLADSGAPLQSCPHGYVEQTAMPSNGSLRSFGECLSTTRYSSETECKDAVTKSFDGQNMTKCAKQAALSQYAGDIWMNLRELEAQIDDAKNKCLGIENKSNRNLFFEGKTSFADQTVECPQQGDRSSGSEILYYSIRTHIYATKTIRCCIPAR